MKVKVEFIVETEDYGAEEFQKEVEALVGDIDPQAVVSDFKMYEVLEQKQ